MAEAADNSNYKMLKIKKRRAVAIFQDGEWRHAVWVWNIN
jgi:hypothetical protein